PYEIVTLSLHDALPISRLERALRVVDAGVDHLGIARARMRADRVLRLEDHHLAARQRERAGDREADHARADYDRVKLFHGAGERSEEHTSELQSLAYLV